jgi:coenzyme F420-reducing hydrogenase delta subunit
MKRKEFIEILNEVLINHHEVHCQMRADIIEAVIKQIIIKKHNIEAPVITDCEAEKIKESIKKHLDRNKNVGLIFFNKKIFWDGFL